VSKTIGPEQFLTRRNLLLAGAILCTAGVIWSYFSNTRTQVSRRSAMQPVKSLPIEDILKPGALPDIALGAADAPVTIVEYASMTCPACASFHNQILPALKEKYIDTGKVRLVFREYPTDDLAILASMAVRCAGKEKTESALPMVSVLFTRQAEWATSKSMAELRAKLGGLGLQVGLTRSAFNACFPSSAQKLTSDQRKLLEDLNKNAQRGAAFGVERTPTFFVNGTKLEGVASVEDFDKAIEPLLKK
jgi:protein-disulfide isomerase